MTEIPDHHSDLEAALASVRRQADSAYIIVGAGLLESWLEMALTRKMRLDLPKSMATRLFSGYGPLSSFSSKNDVAYALGLINREVHKDIRAIKDIRNTFAHTIQYIHINSPELESHFQKLTGWTKERNKRELFTERVKACMEAADSSDDALTLGEALAARADKPASSEGSDGSSAPGAPKRELE